MYAHRFRFISFLALLFSGLATSAEAQEWARKMFETNSHDFGTVAAGSDAVFKFNFKNLYEEDVRVVGVSSSCNCTSATIENPEIKTHESGAIVARFNTRAFRDRKSATLRVTIDKPFNAEVQLIVSGNIRGNVMFEPGSIQFGEITQGTMTEKRIRVVHYGNMNWQITDVKTTFSQNDIKVGLAEPVRYNGTVSYEMLVQLQEGVEPGFIQGELFIETNEGNNVRYPLMFGGQVLPALQLSTPVLTLGPIEPGEVVERNIMLKASKPFRVTSIVSSDDCLQIEASEKETRLHSLKVRYTAGETTGRHECQAKIETSLSRDVTLFKTITTVEKKQ